MGIISVVRTFSQSFGPTITGFFVQRGVFWVTFVVAGVLKAAYDLGLLVGFINHEGNLDKVDKVDERTRGEDEEPSHSE
jgi:hypothetical protein